MASIAAKVFEVEAPAAPAAVPAPASSLSAAAA